MMRQTLAYPPKKKQKPLSFGGRAMSAKITGDKKGAEKSGAQAIQRWSAGSSPS
jgi:hypothetical protein